MVYCNVHLWATEKFVQKTRVCDFQSVAADRFRVFKETGEVKCKGSEHQFATKPKPKLRRRANREEITERARGDSISKPANHANIDFDQTGASLSKLLLTVIVT